MVDRHWLGDLALAILVVLAPIALARPLVSDHQQRVTPAAAKLAAADRLPGNGRIGLLG